jgi:GT2 family glycosyltransferase
VDAVSGAAFVIRRDLFEALGGFDETFFMYMEDTDLSWRARLLGYRCLFAPESIVYHDYALHFGPRKTFYQERNRYLLLLKNLRWRTLLLLAPALLLAEVVTWGFVLMKDRENLGNKVRAYAWIVRHWKVIRTGRQRIQATRRIPDRLVVPALNCRLEFEQVGHSWMSRVSHWVFDPAFGLWRTLMKLTVVW